MAVLAGAAPEPMQRVSRWWTAAISLANLGLFMAYFGPRLCSLALELGCYADYWRLAYAMRDYFFTVKAFAPWIASHHVALLATKRGGDLWAQAATRNDFGMAFAEQGQLGAALVQHQRALTLMRTLGDSQGVATTLGHQAWVSHAADQHEAAISLAMQANELNRRHDNRRLLAIMDRTIALAYSRTGQHRKALGHLAECQEILTELKGGTCHAFAAEQSIACGGIGEQARAVKGQAVAASTAAPSPGSPQPSLDHPVAAMIAWCVLLIAVCVPLALRRFRTANA